MFIFGSLWTQQDGSGAKVKYSWLRKPSPSVFPVYQVNGTCSSGMCKFQALIFLKGLVQTPKCTCSCRHLRRNMGLFNCVWNTYSEERFKKTFRVSRGTFQFILCRIRHVLERDAVNEDPISPECRLAICLYRLARGDYYYTISEMTGLGVSTVCTIVKEVTKAIVEKLWDECVTKHMPKTEDEFRNKMIDTEQLWQFPCCWSAVDGCHITIKCPPGGPESRKEYYNFKNFYSVTMMGMVDSNYRFIWGTCGFPGNSHDVIILLSTKLWADIRDSELLPRIAKGIGWVTVPLLVLGDSAFPFQTWMMKPYGNAVPTPKQRYFNYRLSRARMVTEGCYGQLKRRWRVTLRKNESSKDEVKTKTLACMVLHNIYIDRGETLSRKLDLTLDPVTNQRRDRNRISELLQMTSCEKIRDSSKQVNAIRDALTEKLFMEKQTGMVC